jgi:hypothetical protein
MNYGSGSLLFLTKNNIFYNIFLLTIWQAVFFNCHKNVQTEFGSRSGGTILPDKDLKEIFTDPRHCFIGQKEFWIGLERYEGDWLAACLVDSRLRRDSRMWGAAGPDSWPAG